MPGITRPAEVEEGDAPDEIKSQIRTLMGITHTATAEQRTLPGITRPLTPEVGADGDAPDGIKESYKNVVGNNTNRNKERCRE